MADAEQELTPAARLWRFATAVYADAAVATACLAVQDRHGVDVNLVLFAAWCASEGVAVDAARLRCADERSAAWRRDVVSPLRTLRRRWKRDAPHADAYDAIKTVELEAERQQLAFIAPLAPAGAAPRGGAGGGGDGDACGEARMLLGRNLEALCAVRHDAAPLLVDCETALAATAPFQSAARKPPDW